MGVKVTKPQINTRELATQVELQTQYIGTAEVSSQKVSVQNELNIPVGDSNNRPTNVPAGSTRWNTQLQALEVYSGTTWLEVASEYAPTSSTALG